MLLPECLNQLHGVRGASDLAINRAEQNPRIRVDLLRVLACRGNDPFRLGEATKLTFLLGAASRARKANGDQGGTLAHADAAAWGLPRAFSQFPSRKAASVEPGLRFKSSPKSLAASAGNPACSALWARARMRRSCRILDHFHPPQTSPAVASAKNSTGCQRLALDLIRLFLPAGATRTSRVHVHGPIYPRSDWAGNRASEPLSTLLDSLRRARSDYTSLPSGSQIAPGAVPMPSRSSGPGEPAVNASSAVSSSGRQIGSFAVLAVSGWCGLVSGLLEVAITVVRKKYFDADHFYGMSAQFIWLVPLVSFLFFSVLGLVLSQVVRWGANSQRIATRALATLTLVPLFWAVFPRIYGAAGFLLMMGVALQLVPMIERQAHSFGRVVRFTFPGAFCLLMVLAVLPQAASWASVRQRGSAAVTFVKLSERSLDRARTLSLPGT